MPKLGLLEKDASIDDKRAVKKVRHVSVVERSRKSKKINLRKYLKISQEEFARILGVSVRSVARWESEGIQPSLGAQEIIKFLFKISKRLDDIMDRENIKDWLTANNPVFLNQPPVDLVQSKFGRIIIENEIDRAEWGIPG